MLLASQDDVEVVGEAADGQEAVDVVRRCQPDVILMDLNMPRMSGIAAATHIQNSLKDAIIIGLCVMQDTY